MRTTFNLKLALGLVGLLIATVANGQKANEFEEIPTWRWKGAYYGESLIHPGVKIGAEKTLKSWLKTKERKREKRPSKERFRQVFLVGNVNGFNVPNSEFNLSVNAGIGYRRTNEKGKFFSPVLTVGAARYFYNIPTYELGETEPRKVRGAGRNAYTFSFGVEFGKDLFISSGRPLAWYIKPSLLARAPHNHSYNITATVEAGVIVHSSLFKGK